MEKLYKVNKQVNTKRRKDVMVPRYVTILKVDF